MQARRWVIALLVAGACVALGSCKSRSGSVTTATGWKYNDPKYGGYEVVEGYTPVTGPGLVFIEGGTFIMGRVEQDVMYDWNNSPRRVTVSSFYIDEVETTNVVYKEYLYWLSRVFVTDKDIYRAALPDTLVWREPMAYNEPFVEDYLRHPAYNQYPVVGVSWVQAMDFAQWRSNRVNEKLLVDKGVIELSLTQQDEHNFDTDAYLLGRYQPEGHKGLPSMKPGEEESGRRVLLEDGILLPKYRLPTEAEWEFAATGLLGNTVEENVAERKIYPWNGHNVRNSKAKDLGRMMANFVRGRGDYMGTAGDLNDKGDIPEEVTSFWPNDYGLYCMAGNVNEWVLDVYRPLSSEDVQEFRPYRGNVFQNYKRDPNDRTQIAGVNKWGQIEKEPIKPEEIGDRRNYDRAYYVNYRDGDVESGLMYNEPGSMTDSASTTVMYQQGVEQGKVKNYGMTSLINDRARVYKGGGWRDRAYWLSPGARRFLDERASACDLGFRLAMNAVGKPAAADRK